MARPSLKEQRRTEILDAMERCIARYGVAGATLERIADEAGVKRPALRHFVGNREDLIVAVSDRFFDRADEQTRSLHTATEQGLTVDALVDSLFDASYSDTHSVLMTEAFIAASAEDKRIRRRMTRFISQFTDVVVQALRRTYPAARPADCRDVAAGIVGIYFNVESLTPLGRIQDIRRSSRNAARRLAATLETP